MNRIKELRREKGLSLKELSNEIGISSATLSRYETEKRKPKIENWSKLADFFGVSIGYIQGTSEIRKSFYGEDDPFDAFVNAIAVHQDKEGNAGFGKNYTSESVAFSNDMSVKSFRTLCQILNTNVFLDNTKKEIEENAKIISNINDMRAINTIQDTLGEFFKLSLRAYSGDAKAKNAMDNIHKIIYQDYLGIGTDDYS
ncbi:helix-turn-helix transcriptional regulator [Ligilactobacillus saerimneri]|uniref:helix-turn-helix domain-containing protein n=1 Tax=Ligilactobacillus saerimneri TaxID=228229 RepID=UPI0022A7D587|nr:helix-turn-helix transcriptional regulator [Ligilactobacillus saerimneri]MCZ0891847.1 helix-turn-helix transcriptional regulator [Ligilactobacillus saerimneri]